MSDSNQSANESGGESAGKGGGRKRKRSYRNRRRGRKPQNERNETRNNEARSKETRNSEPRGEEEGERTRARSNRRGAGRGKAKSSDAGLDPVKRARRDRRRRKRDGGRDGVDRDGGDASVAAVEAMPELNIEPKQVFIYTHVVRPALRDAYEYRAEHFSKTGRTLDDFHIDLSSILIYPDDNPENEPVIDLHIGAGPVESSAGEEADWDDEEPFGDEPAVSLG